MGDPRDTIKVVSKYYHARIPVYVYAIVEHSVIITKVLEAFHARLFAKIASS